jgi:SNF2 family DNA or RNA helicase
MDSVDSKETYFIYDKAEYNALKKTYSHAYSVMSRINIATIFNSDFDMVENEKAIENYHKLFNHFDSILDVRFNQEFDFKLFNFYLFNVHLSYIMVVSVSWQQLDKYMRNSTKFNTELLLTLCRNHCHYERESNRIKLSQTYDAQCDEYYETKYIELMKSIVDNVASTANDIEMIEQPAFSIKLYPYQKRNIKWMIDKEKSLNKMYINSNNETIIDKTIVNYSTCQIKPIDDTIKHINLNGGVLMDEVGMGKTIQIIIMSLLNKPTITDIKQPCYDRLYAKGNLVICPSQLCGQWIREFSKVVDKTYPLTIIPFYNKIHHDKYTYDNILNANFVVTSFTFLNSKHFTSQISSPISVHSMDSLNKAGTELYNSDHKKTLIGTNVQLLLLLWNRIIIDEFHELNAQTKNNQLLTTIKLFKSNYRWCMTGTPFDKTHTSLLNIINFISHCDNNLSIISNASVFNHVKHDMFRRNTKKSVEEEYKLPPLKETVLKLQFSKTEWLLYYAYLADSNIDKFSPLVRQMCCHPKIATEIKSTLSNCKTLDDIEDVMLTHYKKSLDDAERIMLFVEYTLNTASENSKVKKFRFYKRLLKSIGYKPVIDYVAKKFVKPNNSDAVLDMNEFRPDGILIPPDIQELEADEEEEEGAAEDKLQKIVISDSNIDEIIQLISRLPRYKERVAKPTILEQYVTALIDKKNTVDKIYQGKLRTYTYFKGVIDKLLFAEKTLITDLRSNENTTEENPELETCTICLSVVSGTDLGVISKCGHIYCFNCINPYITTHKKCPMCKLVVSPSDIFKIRCNLNNIAPPTETEITQNTLINKVGTKIANLIFFLKTTDKHVIVFSQWDDLLKKVGETLTEHGITNLFCRGHVWQRDKAIRDFNNSNTIKVIMLSSESAASGTNLTKAEIVILLDPVYGTAEHRRNTEWQAIGRAYRMGQTKTVEVIRFVMENSVEQEIYDSNIKHDKDMNINSDVNNMQIVMDKSIVTNIVQSATTIVKKPRKKTIKP